VSEFTTGVRDHNATRTYDSRFILNYIRRADEHPATCERLINSYENAIFSPPARAEH
jgi:hypothetical protein